MGASPASVVAANAVVAFGMMRNRKISAADAVKARSVAEKWIRLPKKLWPEARFDSDVQ